MTAHFAPKKIQSLDVARLREVLDYNPETGALTWRKMLSPRGVVGSAAGRVSKHGYLLVGIDGIYYLGHHLAWLHFHGEPPKWSLDHRNLNKLDNSIANLREATARQNAINRAPRNKHGFKGVSFQTCSGKFKATIRTESGRLFLGEFPTAAEAGRAYAEKAAEMHGEFARIETKPTTGTQP